jgi:nicotinate-nucleotide pyrophosphorylase (carboxylating)
MNIDEMTQAIDDLVTRALDEDLGEAGDITSRAILPEEQLGRAVIRSKETGVLAGTALLEPLFHRLDRALRVETHARDGARLEPGSPICMLEGRVRAILAGERIALNLLQRLSGIATRTAALVALVEGTGCRILDTRKTTPSLRLLEKQAVLAGGGCNHRFGLYDMFLIKDTHVAAAGGPAPAIRKAKAFRGSANAPAIEVEVQTEKQFHEAVSEKPDRIMLDNMPPEAMARCVRYLREREEPIETEASGTITEETIRTVARTGVDFISVGALTHSVRALDIHLVLL